MMIKRALALTLIYCGLGILTIGISHAEKTVLTVHHFLSSSHILQTALLEPLGRALEDKSSGELSLAIYPSMTLGGKAQDLYTQVRDGSVDIAWSLIGYTPGVFPRSEIFELPGVHHASAIDTSLAMYDIRDKLAADFNKVQLLFLHVHPGNAIHTTDKDVARFEDLRGLKLRTPSRTGAWMIETWEASPVGMPIPALPQALSRGALDGALVPFEVMPSLGLEKLTNYSIVTAGNGRFGTAVFMLIMNKERFDALSKEHQNLLLAETGEERIKDISTEWQASDMAGVKIQEATGTHVRMITKNNMEAFTKLFEQVTTRWIKEVEAKDIDGKNLLKSARDAVAARAEQTSNKP